MLLRSKTSLLMPSVFGSAAASFLVQEFIGVLFKEQTLRMAEKAQTEAH